MEIVSARTFRSNQTAILSKVLKGEAIFLTSRVGTFKITPVSEADNLTSRISEGIKEAKMMEAGKIPVKSAKDFLNEL